VTALDLGFDPASFSGRVPLFPLPGTVLLPGGVLPLHVFEPRYRAMVDDALRGERFIAMALLRPGYEQDYEGCPEIEPAVCVGRVALEQRLPDGRWNLVLLGLCRARVVEEDRTRAYRLASVDLLRDPPLAAEEEAAQARDLARRLAALPPRLVRDAARLATALELLPPDRPGELPLGLKLDLAADQFHLSPAERQRLLETAGVAARATLLLDLLGARAEEVRRLGLRPAWPPPLSPY
jgi:hypothetical protein